jgi:predicted nucleotidyltransferase
LIKNSELISFLEYKYTPEAIILFGSFSKGENGKNSDIDILIISPIKNGPAGLSQQALMTI